MSAVLSKLTMCVCAAGTGAAVVPVAHAVHRAFAPHRAAHHARPAAGPVAASARDDCLPAAALPAIAGAGALGGSVLPIEATPLPQAASGGPGNGFPFYSGGSSGDDLGYSGYGGGGFAGGGGGGGGGIGGGTGGGIPGGGGPGTQPPGTPPGTPGIPSASNAPEPASWALMVGGFGVLGGAMRYGRAATARTPVPQPA